MAPPKLNDSVADRALTEGALDFVDLELRGHPHVPLDEPTVHQLLEMVNTAKTELMDTQRKILLINPVDLDDHKKEHFRLLKQATSFHSQLHGIKITFLAAAAPPPPTGTSAGKQDFRLPRIDLPTFDGTITNWVSFRDMFVTAVDGNTSLSKAQKLTYLKSRVTGEALRQINSIIISDANYDIAWDLLNSRYHSERELFFSTMQRFQTQSSSYHATSSNIRSIVDSAKECISALEKLLLPSNPTSEAILMFSMVSKLDTKSKELWEQSLPSSKLPTLKELYEFLETRARSLAASESSSPFSKTSSSSKPAHGKGEENRRHVKVHHAQSSSTCKYCNKENHPLFRCSSFLAASPTQRHEHVKKNSLCFNCLSHGHGTKNCSNLGTCRTCHQRHHTLLHLQKESRDNTASAAESTPPPPVMANHVQQQQTEAPQTLLATAVVRVEDSHGRSQLCRALLDGGSSASFITEDCVLRLSLPREKSSLQIRGLSSASLGTCRGTTSITLRPHFSSLSSHCVNPLILTTVTCRLPTTTCNAFQWPHLNGLQLADPNFNTPAKIDLLLGSDVFWALLQDGKMTGPSGSPIALNSSLGWLVAGSITTSSKVVHVHYAETELDKSLQRLWELDHVSTTTPITQEEAACEEHFSTTHSRQPDGRIVVKLPMKTPSLLGESKAIAIRRLHSLERRFIKEPARKEEYLVFMREYLSLGHMELLSNEEDENPRGPPNYMPHHWVLKEESTTTKFRVVFDASCKTSNGKSLNDVMMVGPTIQDGLIDIITRFRRHLVALTADVAKMYRQVLVDPSQQDLQRILWRESPDHPILPYRLLTVTYGTASAPFLATRALQQIASDGERQFPEAARVLKEDCYVDDCLTGAPSQEEAISLQKGLSSLIQTGAMELRKWRCNSSSVLAHVPDSLKETKEDVSVDCDPSSKALGLLWNTSTDSFHFRVYLPPTTTFTKRTVTSQTAKLFDPLGWLSPVMIVPKCFIQSLWKLELGWDASLPPSTTDEWRNFLSCLHHIESISIPRCFSTTASSNFILFGFCDASERAYAAVVYVAAINNANCRVSIVAAKTRVAPAKQVSLPRLELCSAHLLSNLLQSVRQKINLSSSSTYAFSDSTISLAWIAAPSTRWKTFVANRVADIQRNLPDVTWHHVKGEENPADCASRGISPQELLNHPLWWTGPSWLPTFHLQQTNTTTTNTFHPDEDEMKKEERLAVPCHFASKPTEDAFQGLIARVSSWNRLRRVAAWLRRFVHNCRNPQQHTTGPLSTQELRRGETLLLHSDQQQYFFEDLKQLTSMEQLHHKSKLLPLSPFIDDDGLIRVGGRLRHAAIAYNKKHPIVLPRHSLLTKAIIVSTHLDLLHAGPQLTLAALNQRYWVVRGRDAVRLHLLKCIRCHRLRAATQEQLMGNLPSVRVTPSRAFLKSGVDYAGPFSIRPMTRGKTQLKSYICLFVCLTTRAIHLELVSSLSTEAFLAALRRFTSRRGRPEEIRSDCGTNFIGADKELMKLVTQSAHNTQLADQLSLQGIKWSFNPPGAPHFGGIWEAGVKSVKHHLKRVLSSSLLTFEEFSTVLCQVEACLNSRPLTPISTNPDDLQALTPGHFLIGGPLTSVADPNLLEVPINRVSRWQLLPRLQQDFWKRWSGEYITRLQQRPKWMKIRSNLKTDDMVLIKEENLPPQQWRLGRIICVHPGADGIIRVATVRTSSGELKRPITKLSLLPIDNAASIETDISRPAECLVPT